MNENLLQQRLVSWCQTPDTKIADSAQAASLIERVGVATLYPVSSEIPNLFHAYTGDPAAVTDSAWDTPSGHVYAWRWELGQKEAGFYTSLVRGRPTWVSWALLPAVLRLLGETRTPDELFDLGVISQNSYRVAQALEEAGRPLTTRELRREASFPTGKEQRAAYLHGVQELDTRLLLAKVFLGDENEMGHALVAQQYPDATRAAENMTREDALDLFLHTYLQHAVYAVPSVLSKHLKLPVADLQLALDRLADKGSAQTASGTDRVPTYLWVRQAG